MTRHRLSLLKISNFLPVKFTLMLATLNSISVHYLYPSRTSKKLRGTKKSYWISGALLMSAHLKNKCAHFMSARARRELY